MSSSMGRIIYPIYEMEKKWSKPPTSQPVMHLYKSWFLPRDVQKIPPPSANLSRLGMGPK